MRRAFPRRGGERKGEERAEASYSIHSYRGEEKKKGKGNPFYLSRRPATSREKRNPQERGEKEERRKKTRLYLPDFNGKKKKKGRREVA